MKYVDIDSKKLKGKINYSAILVFFGIAVLIYLIIQFFGLSGIIKWILYLISAFFVLIAIECLTTHEISYCRLCDKAFDFDVTKCPICGNELEHMGKGNVEDIREKATQEKKNIVDSATPTTTKSAHAASKASSTPSKTSVPELERKKDIDGLILALKDNDRKLRQHAAYALGNLPDKRAVEPLIYLLEDNHKNVRRNAAISLGKLNDTRAVEPLIHLINDSDNKTRKNAVIALGKLGDKSAIPALNKAFYDEAMSVRAEAENALFLFEFEQKSVFDEIGIKEECEVREYHEFKYAGLRNAWHKKTFEGHTEEVLSVAFSPDGKYALSGSGGSLSAIVDSNVRLWDVETGECIRVFSGHINSIYSMYSVYSVVFSPDGKHALSGGHNLRLWDVETGACIKAIKQFNTTIYSVAFSPDGRYVLSGDHETTINLWDINTGNCVKTFDGHTDDVKSVAFSPDGRFALSGSLDSTVRLWDVETGKCTRVFTGHIGSVFSVVFSPDGRYALSGSYDKTLCLWDVETGECSRIFEGHSDAVNSVVFSSNGKNALSGSRDNTIRLWDIKTGVCIRTIKNVDANSVAFSPDDRYALCGGNGEIIYLWEFDWELKFDDTRLLGSEIEKTEYKAKEEETQTLTQIPRQEEELTLYEAASDVKTSTLPETPKEERTHFLLEGVEEALPSEIKIWQEGEVIEDLYEVKEVIRTGGMGVVYIVDHKKWNFPLAVKSPRSEVMRSHEKKVRFFREAETWIDIGKHPDIATAYYVRTIAGIPHIFIEYVDGGNLKDWIEHGKLKDWETTLRIAIEFCNGMAYAHDRGLIHRDIKPANVLMTKEGKAKITDFGLIKGTEELLSSQKEEGAANEPWKTMTGVGGVFGTPAYMSPEQWDDPHGVGKEGDIYSFGVVLYEMIAGKRPFEPSPDVAPQAKVFFYKKMHQEDQPPELREIREDINTRLEKLVLKCLSKEINNRYPSFKDVKTELEEIYSGIIGTQYHGEVIDAVALKADDLNNKALSFMDLGMEEDAVRCWQEALKLNSHHLEATFNIGYWEWKHVKITDDQYLYRIHKLESSHDNYPIYWHSLGLIHIERGDLEEADVALKRAMALGFNGAEVYNALGTVHLGREEFGLAKEAFSEAIQLSPDKWQPRFYLASTLFHDGNRGNCLEEVSTLLENPRWKEELTTQGITDVNTALKSLLYHKIPCGCLIRAFQGHINDINSVALSPDEKYALSAGSGYPDDNILRLWDVETEECTRIFEGHTNTVNSVTFSPDCRYALSGGDDTNLHLWDVETGECIKIFEGHANTVNSVAFSPDGRYALAGGSAATLCLWDVKTGECIKTFESHNDHVNSVAFSRHNLPSEINIATPRAITSVAFSPDGVYGLSGSEDKNLQLWNIETGECVRTFEGHTESVHSVAFTPDSEQVLSGSWDNTIRLWNVGTGECIREFKGYIREFEGYMTSVAFSPNGRFALSVETTGTGADFSEKGNLQLWDVGTGKCIRTFDTFEKSIAFSPNGRFVLSGNNETLLLREIRYPTNASIYPIFSFLLCRPVSVQESVKAEKEVEVLIGQARSLIELNSFAQAYRFLRKAQDYQGFEHHPEIMELLTLCRKQSK